MASSVIRNFIAKGLFKKKGAIASSKAVDFSADALEQRLRRVGVDPNAITNENELNQVLSYLKQTEDASFSQQFGNMLAGSKFDKKADVLDMTGKKIPEGSGILGGKQIKPIDELNEFNPKDPMKQYGKEDEITKSIKLEKEGKKLTDSMSDAEIELRDNFPYESDAAIKARLDADNKKGIAAIKNNRMLDEDEITQLDLDIGGLEYTNDFDGTVGSANKLRKERAKYIADMELEYKKGNLDPGPGEANRKKFLQDKFDEMEASGDTKLMTRDEVEELSSFDLQTDMDKAVGKFKKKDAKQKKIIKDFDPGDRDPNAQGGRIGYAEGTPDKKGILDMLDIQASGSKSGKQQIKGAPDGITIDSESLNAIAKADIPISQKVDLILEYKYGKNRNRIDYKDQEIKMDEGGYKDQDIGFGYNQGGDGFSGSVMRDLRTGDDELKINFKKNIDFNRLFRADGGRIGLAGGMTKRAFLKLMGTGAAGIAALKSGVLGLGKGATKQAAKEVVQQTTSSTPPPYFFKLVEKIKTLGDDTLATQDKAIAKKYKDYTMEEDFAGNIEIIKKGDENLMLRDADVYMSYKVDDVPIKGKKGSKKVEEYEEYTARPDKEGKMKDIEQGVPDEIIREVEAGSGNVPESFYTGPNAIKKADGGLAAMLGE